MHAGLAVFMKSSVCFLCILGRRLRSLRIDKNIMGGINHEWEFSKSYFDKRYTTKFEYLIDYNFRYMKHIFKQNNGLWKYFQTNIYN